MSSFLKKVLLCTTLLAGPAAAFAQDPDPSLIQSVTVETVRGFDRIKPFNFMPSLAFNLKSQKASGQAENSLTLGISNETVLPHSLEFSVSKQIKRHGGPYKRVPREVYIAGVGLQHESVEKTILMKTGEEKVSHYDRGGVYGFFIATPWDKPIQPRHSPFIGSVRLHTGVVAGMDSRNTTLAAIANLRFGLGYKLSKTAVLGLSTTAGAAFVHEIKNTEVAKTSTNAIKPYTTANIIFQIALK